MSSKTTEPPSFLELTAPVKLNDSHDLDEFDCGDESLNDFLRQKAYKNHKNKVSITHVICEKGTDKVLGYYSITVGAVARGDFPKARQRNMPNPIPVAVLGRLAVDLSIQGMGKGGDLLKDVFERVYAHSNESGCAALVVNAIDQTAADFYKKFGFSPFPEDPLSLYVTLKTEPG